MYPADIAAMGDLVIVGKLLAAEGKVDPQTHVMYTDVIVEVQKVIRNVTDQEVKVGSTINFRQIGGEIGNRKTDFIGEAEFRKEETGDLLLLSLKRPNPEEIPADIRFKYRRLRNLERSIRRLAMDGLPEAVIIAISREEIARVKGE